jgi:hypothetical protein
MVGHFRSEKSEETFWNNYVHKIRRCRPLLFQHLQTYVTADRVHLKWVREYLIKRDQYIMIFCFRSQIYSDLLGFCPLA